MSWMSFVLKEISSCFYPCQKMIPWQVKNDSLDSPFLEEGVGGRRACFTLSAPERSESGA